MTTAEHIGKVVVMLGAWGLGNSSERKPEVGKEACLPGSSALFSTASSRQGVGEPSLRPCHVTQYLL